MPLALHINGQISETKMRAVIVLCGDDHDGFVIAAADDVEDKGDVDVHVDDYVEDKDDVDNAVDVNVHIHVDYVDVDVHIHVMLMLIMMMLIMILTIIHPC